MQRSYDVVIVGGAVVGSSVAWWLSANPDFAGTVLVVERDPSYADTSTARTNSCMRQQFTNPLNVQISQFAADFVRNFGDYMGTDDAPQIDFDPFGYMYLAADDDFAATLRANQQTQLRHGAATRILSPAEIAAAYPFYYVDDIVCGSHNTQDEGWFDSWTMFEWLKRQATAQGVTYTEGEVVAVNTQASRVTSVTLATGTEIGCGTLVNASGPRAAATAAMANIELPVEPRKRYSFVFEAAQPLGQPLPLTIDPTGVHVRTDGGAYLAGCTPDIDPTVEFDDFAMDGHIWEEKVWPALAHRIPAFDKVRVRNSWAGHYAVNLLDHNAVVGPHPEITNFVFANGFSGHGMQQSPAVGRAVAEHITYGSYQTLNFTPLGYERIARGEPFVEGAII